MQGSGVGSEGSRLEVCMKSHKSELAITFIHTTQETVGSSPRSNTGSTAEAPKQPVTAGTLG